MKKNIAITSEKLILAIGPCTGGSQHDYPLLKTSGFLDVIIHHFLWMDLGFLGIKKDYKQHTVLMPTKKPYLKDFTQEQKNENAVISSIRVIVEHFFAKLKKYHIIAHTYRSRLYGNFHTVRENRKQQIMLIACGLVNLMSLI